MTRLTLSHIRRNPWTVLIYELPENPPRMLLETAQFAATCLRAIAGELLDEFECGQAGEDWCDANRKIGEIIYLLDERYGVEPHDFWFVRSKPKKSTNFARLKAWLTR